MALWSKVLSFFAGIASAEAASAVAEPTLEPARQNAWARRPFRVLDPGTAARASVQGIDLHGVDLADDARRDGFYETRFAIMQELARVAPPVAETLEMWRRDKITRAQAEHALDKGQIEPQYHAAILELFNERLDPSQIALGIVRSLIKDPNFLPVDLDTTGGKVPAYGVSPIDPIDEARAAGIDRERLRVMVGEIGLPMALQSAASAVFRDIIERSDFNRAVLEGDTRPEWADAIFEQARQIPSVADYVNAHIRGWITRDEMHAGAQRHGMRNADTDLLYLRTGRPAAPGQMATAAARGIDGPDKVPMNREQFLKGIAESDIRPEWGPMLWESRFLYPPLFQLTRLVQAGAITADTARDWAVKDRYPPEVVNALHTYWSQAPAAQGDTHISKAEVQLWTATHRSYLTGELTDADATSALTAAGVAAASIPAVLQLWAQEATIQRKLLTPAQIKRAYRKAVVNPTTGQPWTRDEALAALVERGYRLADANTFLDE